MTAEPKLKKKIAKLMPPDNLDYQINIPFYSQKVFLSEKQAIEYLPEFIRQLINAHILEPDVIIDLGNDKHQIDKEKLATAVQELSIYTSQ